MTSEGVPGGGRSLALGFGIVAAPCLVINSSNTPQGGLTRLALPFMSLGELSPEETQEKNTADYYYYYSYY